MGMPASNGDFAGVIKNSFLIENGQRGPALAETMVSGNVAQMLLAITGVGKRLHDSGAWCVPWLRVSGLHFS
jgi:PmbA protein